jgi:hypothetical protein
VVFVVVVILTDESLGTVRHPPKGNIQLPTEITTVKQSALPNKHSSNGSSAREQQSRKVSATNADYSLQKVFLSFSFQAQHRKQMLFTFCFLKAVFLLIRSPDGIFFLIRIVRGGVQTGSTRHVSHFWPIVPAPGDSENGEFGGMKIGRGNRCTRRKPAPASL